MTSLIKDGFQVAAWGVAVVGGLIAAFKAIAEWRKDHRWRQAEMAKTCLDEIRADELSHAAMRMLDWTGLCFDLPGHDKTSPISHEQRRFALRTVNTVFPSGDPGPFVRDAFDALFDRFERLEHFIRIKLIRFEDVEPPLTYYVGKLAAEDEREVTTAFLDAYGFELAANFLKRFPEWRAV